jgi:hypothetical protein
MSINNVVQEEHIEERQPKGMQFVSRLNRMGDYFYLRIPKARNESAEKFRDMTLFVRFSEVVEGET